MFASTNVFTASALFGATPSVSTLNGAEPLTDRVEDACAVTLPAVLDVKVIVHWPFPLVFPPAFVQVPVAAVWFAPFESVSVKSTCSLAAATKPAPLPVSFITVTEIGRAHV